MLKKIFNNKYHCIIFGMAIAAFTMYNIHYRCHITEGGIFGLSLLYKHWFNISPAYSSLVLDVTCFILGDFLLRKGFMFDSLITSVLYSLWYLIWESIGPLLYNFVNMPFVAATFGGIGIGVGVGLVVKHNIAAGGDDTICLIINKYFKISVKYVYHLLDAVVLLLSLSYIPYKSIIYSLYSALISGYIIDRFHKINTI